MQSICVNASRVVARAIRNGYSTLVAETAQKPRLVSVSCGFSKNFLREKALVKRGKFGDDAWFAVSSKNADVLGTILFYFFGFHFHPYSNKKKLFRLHFIDFLLFSSSQQNVLLFLYLAQIKFGALVTSH